MHVVNSLSGYQERGASELAFLWCLLFGPFYFAAKGVWQHAVISLLVVICTHGIAWLVYPFFAKGIVNRSYQRPPKPRKWRRS